MAYMSMSQVEYIICTDIIWEKSWWKPNSGTPLGVIYQNSIVHPKNE